jgi:hypothetical protein
MSFKTMYNITSTGGNINFPLARPVAKTFALDCNLLNKYKNVSCVWFFDDLNAPAHVSDFTPKSISASTPVSYTFTYEGYYYIKCFADLDGYTVPIIQELTIGTNHVNINTDYSKIYNTVIENVQLYSFNSTDKIYYTIDGTTPTTSSILYTGPLTFNPSTILGHNVKKGSFDLKYVGYDQFGSTIFDQGEFTFTFDTVIPAISMPIYPTKRQLTNTTNVQITCNKQIEIIVCSLKHFGTSYEPAQLISESDFNLVQNSGDIIFSVNTYGKQEINIYVIDASGFQSNTLIYQWETIQ